MIALARCQSIPDSNKDTILYSKVSKFLDAIVVNPPFNYLLEDLNELGQLVLPLLESPLSVGLLIVMALGADMSDEQIAHCCTMSFAKELKASSTRRASTSWDWDMIFNPTLSGVVHPQYPSRSRLQRQFYPSLLRFRNSMMHRTILPHYTRRGVSSSTIEYLLHRKTDPWHHRLVKGNPRTYHSQLRYNNVTSRDVIHEFIRTGIFPRGSTEMKQVWTPNQLMPRTYYCWGGFDIYHSSYLREFFNGLADCFEPTQRLNRVNPHWLRDPRTRHGGGFSFYDLTSFTSWFHEHEPFLRSVEKFFLGVTVMIVVGGCQLQEQDLGLMIRRYIECCNDVPLFEVQKKLSVDGLGERLHFLHQTAGFLGVPGNLVTCTLAHGLALASCFESSSQLQVPGDDVGFAFFQDEFDDDRHDKIRCAETLGVLQYDKVFISTQMALYLKRRVIVYGDSVDLLDMLIYPLIPYLRKSGDQEHDRFKRISNKDLKVRASRVIVTFMRDLWRKSHGMLSDFLYDTILMFLRYAHDRAGLPYGAIFQGKLCDDDEDEVDYGLPIKFSVAESDCLVTNPDRLFVARNLRTMRVRDTSDVVLSRIEADLVAGESITVEKSKAWSFLEDMGYVKIVGIPGEVLTLINEDARDAYITSSEPLARSVRVLSDVTLSMLYSVGAILPPEDLGFQSDVRVKGRIPRGVGFKKYIDLDDPDVFEYYSGSVDYKKGSYADRDSSVEPEDHFSDLY